MIDETTRADYERLAGAFLDLGFPGHELEISQVLREIGYYDAPASKGHHLAERGGLLVHSVNVTQRLLELSVAWHVDWPRVESPYLVGMLHDLVKCRCYRPVPKKEPGEVQTFEYVQPEFHGHGACSVAIAASLGFRLMREEIAAIMFHMGPWGVGNEYTEAEFRAAMDAFPSCIVATHTADWYAAAVDERGGKDAD